MSKTIVARLQELGLSDKEARLYLALLGFEAAPVQAVAATAKLHRSTAYVLLEALAEKGFVTQQSRDGMLMYTAQEPEELIKMAEASVARAEAAYAAVSDVITDLEALSVRDPGVPHAIFLETPEGVRAMWQEVETAAASGVNVRGFMHRPMALQDRESSDTLRIIAVMSEGVRITDVDNQAAFRFIDEEQYSYTSDLFMFDDTIILLSEVEEFAVRIESREFAEVMREAFDLAWEEAGRVDATLRAKKSGRRSGNR